MTDFITDARGTGPVILLGTTGGWINDPTSLVALRVSGHSARRRDWWRCDHCGSAVEARNERGRLVLACPNCGAPRPDDEE